MRGFELVLELEETGSGARNDRPGWQRILKAASMGQIDAVLVWKLDRAGRSAIDVQSNIEALRRAGVRFICTSQGIDVTPAGDAASNLQLAILAAVAEFERETLRERTRLGLETAKRRGKRLGRIPRVRLDPAEVRALRSSGSSWAEIAAHLHCTVPAARWAASKGVDHAA
jgi:DNA invertase Pin-like site-specific DNA recombinase